MLKLYSLSKSFLKEQRVLMIKKIVLSSIFLLANVAFADVITSTSSLPTSACIEKIRKCYDLKDLDRANCFYDSTTDNQCEDSSLSPVVLRRWSLAPVPPSINVGASALTGSESIDLSCIDSFDQKLLQELTRSNFTDDTIKDLTTKLDQCQRGNPMEMLRP